MKKRKTSCSRCRRTRSLPSLLSLAAIFKLAVDRPGVAVETIILADLLPPRTVDGLQPAIPVTQDHLPDMPNPATLMFALADQAIMEGVIALARAPRRMVEAETPRKSELYC